MGKVLRDLSLSPKGIFGYMYPRPDRKIPNSSLHDKLVFYKNGDMSAYSTKYLRFSDFDVVSFILARPKICSCVGKEIVRTKPNQKVLANLINMIKLRSY